MLLVEEISLPTATFSALSERVSQSFSAAMIDVSSKPELVVHLVQQRTRLCGSWCLQASSFSHRFKFFKVHKREYQHAATAERMCIPESPAMLPTTVLSVRHSTTKWPRLTGRPNSCTRQRGRFARRCILNDLDTAAFSPGFLILERSYLPGRDTCCRLPRRVAALPRMFHR